MEFLKNLKWHRRKFQPVKLDSYKQRLLLKPLFYSQRGWLKNRHFMVGIVWDTFQVTIRNWKIKFWKSFIKINFLVKIKSMKRFKVEQGNLQTCNLIFISAEDNFVMTSTGPELHLQPKKMFFVLCMHIFISNISIIFLLILILHWKKRRYNINIIIKTQSNVHLNPPPVYYILLNFSISILWFFSNSNTATVWLIFQNNNRTFYKHSNFYKRNAFFLAKTGRKDTVLNEINFIVEMEYLLIYFCCFLFHNQLRLNFIPFFNSCLF